MNTDVENQILNLREKIHEIKVFIDSEPWKQYTRLVDSQCNGRVDQMILTPLSGVDAAFGQEYAKGEIAGMRLAVAMMAQSVEDLQTEMESLEAIGAQNE